MNFINLLRYLKGYVTFSGEGGFTERFFNLAANNRIFLWDAYCYDTSLRAKCNLKDYKKLRHIAKKSGVRLKLIKEDGFIFFLKEKEPRKGLLLGGVFFILFFSIMCNFVWTVEVTGNTLVSKEDILVLADNYGLQIGTFKPSFDEVTAANSMAEDSDGVFSWVAFNIKGSRAVIEVREQKKSIKSTDTPLPSNLIADFDGVIVSSENFSGTSCVSEGMGVKKGDLLISGVEDNEDFSVSFVEADGSIVALREKEYGVRYIKDACALKITESHKVIALYIFGIKIPLSASRNKNLPFFKDEAYLSYNGVRLPIGIITKTYFSIAKSHRNEKSLLISSLEEYSESAYSLNKNTFIISEKPTLCSTDKDIIIKNHWSCLDFIGEKQKIIIEN